MPDSVVYAGGAPGAQWADSSYNNGRLADNTSVVTSGAALTFNTVPSGGLQFYVVWPYAPLDGRIYSGISFKLAAPTAFAPGVDVGVQVNSASGAVHKVTERAGWRRVCVGFAATLRPPAAADRATQGLPPRGHRAHHLAIGVHPAECPRRRQRHCKAALCAPGQLCLDCAAPHLHRLTHPGHTAPRLPMRGSAAAPPFAKAAQPGPAQAPTQPGPSQPDPPPLTQPATTSLCQPTTTTTTSHAVTHAATPHLKPAAPIAQPATPQVLPCYAYADLQ